MAKTTTAKKGTAPRRRYILMATAGLHDPVLTRANFQPSAQSVKLAARPALTGFAATAGPDMQVLDSIRADGPKLVSMAPEAELSLRLSVPGLKIVPEVFYHRQWQRFRTHMRPPVKATAKPKKKAGRSTTRVSAVAAAAPMTTSLQITVTDQTDGKPVKGAHMVAFTNFASRAGAEGTTGANGRATLSGLAPNAALERVYVYAPAGYWGHYAANTTGARQSALKLDRVDVKDSILLLPQFYAALPMTAGTGVTVAIIDSGVDGTHPDLPNVRGGLNCVSDEVRADPAAAANWRPAQSEGEHGTHVAGIVAGRGTTSGFRGVAPGATLRAYRVFPDAGGGASNFDITKAIDAAVADRCDIINMSLGGPQKDDLVEAAIARALAAGVVVIVAAGNDNRSAVSYPAALTESVAVSAMGRAGTFPDDSIGTSDMADPKGGAGNKDFIADFSNIGPQVDITGPGVEIVSTLPGQGHGSMSGTSMACPAVAGFAAYLLATDAGLRQAQGADRSRQLKEHLYSKCKPEGFGRDFEGFGLPAL